MAALKKYATFGGRARRAEFWYFSLTNIIIGIVLAIVGFIIHDKGIILGSLYALAMTIPGTAVTVRRLHDTNRSGLWGLIWLVPFVGIIMLLIFMAREDQAGANQYGPNPKEAPTSGIIKLEKTSKSPDAIVMLITAIILVIMMGGALGYVHLIRPTTNSGPNIDFPKLKTTIYLTPGSSMSFTGISYKVNSIVANQANVTLTDVKTGENKTVLLKSGESTNFLGKKITVVKFQRLTDLDQAVITIE